MRTSHSLTLRSGDLPCGHEPLCAAAGAQARVCAVATPEQCEGPEERPSRAGCKHRFRRAGVSHAMPPRQRAGPSKVALRTKPAGICSAEAPPSWRCAARNSSSCASRIITPRSLAASTVPLAASQLRLLGLAGSCRRRRTSRSRRLQRRRRSRPPASSGNWCRWRRIDGARRPAVGMGRRAPDRQLRLFLLQRAAAAARERRPAACPPRARPNAAHRRSDGRYARPRAPTGSEAAASTPRAKSSPRSWPSARAETSSWVCILFITSPRRIALALHQRLPDWFSSMGLTLAEIASRARKIRERTVPIGQFITSAISS